MPHRLCGARPSPIVLCAAGGRCAAPARTLSPSLRRHLAPDGLSPSPVCLDMRGEQHREHRGEGGCRRHATVTPGDVRRAEPLTLGKRDSRDRRAHDSAFGTDHRPGHQGRWTRPLPRCPNTRPDRSPRQAPCTDRLQEPDVQPPPTAMPWSAPRSPATSNWWRGRCYRSTTSSTTSTYSLPTTY